MLNYAYRAIDRDGNGVAGTLRGGFASYPVWVRTKGGMGKQSKGKTRCAS